MPDASINTMMRIRTTLFNQQQRAIDYRAQQHYPKGITLGKFTATQLNNSKVRTQDEYVIPDSPSRRPPKLLLAGRTTYTIGEEVLIYINNIGGPSTHYTTPSLPTGLSIDSTTGTITGTATFRQVSTLYNVTATNDFGSDTLYFGIRILYRSPIISYIGSPFNFIRNSIITPIDVTNTTDPIEYFTGTLPPGLALSPSGQIYGTPTEISSQETYQITAYNEGGAGSTTILATVFIEAPNFDYAYGPYYFTVSNVITPFTPTGIVGNPIFYVTALPATQLPTGLSINSITGEISGTPLVVTLSNEYSIVGSNLGPSGVRTHVDYFGMEILQPPPIISYSPSLMTFTQNSPITPISVINIGGPATSFSVSPSFPSGIVLDTSTGTISGTPLVEDPTDTYIITATGNGTGSTTITITINPQAPDINYTTPQNYSVGSLITPLLPTNSGGTVASYSVVGTALPTGLSLNTTTGAISGTPTVLAYVANFAIQASNITGTSTVYIDISIVRPTPLGVGSFNWGAALAVDKTGVPANNFITGVASDSSNNAYVTGYYLAPTSAILYNSNISGSNTSALPTSSTQRVGYYAKYNPSGALEYASGIVNTGTSNALTNNGICVDSNNNVYICGRYSGGANIYNSNQSSIASNALPFTDAGGTTYGAYAVKYNSQGSNVLSCGIVALTTFSGLGLAEAADVKVDSAGAIYISGNYRATFSAFTFAYCNTSATASNFLPVTSGTNYNTFLVKFNSNGSLAWGAAIGGTVTGSNVSNYSMAIDSADNIYLVGSYFGASNNIYVYSSNYTSSNCNVLTTTSNSRSDSYIVKFGSNGAFSAAASINGCNTDGAGSITIDNSNNIYVSGSYAGLSNTAFIINSNKSSSNSNVLPTISTGFAQYMIKFNSNLNFQMALAVDSRASNVTSNNVSLAIDYSNNIYLVGTCSNNCNIHAYNSNQSAITSNLIRTGSGDASYMICFGSNGAVKYGTSIANSFTYMSKSIATNKNSNFEYIYLGGMYSNTSNNTVAYDSNSNYYSSNILPTPIQANVCNTYLVQYKI